MQLVLPEANILPQSFVFFVRFQFSYLANSTKLLMFHWQSFVSKIPYTGKNLINLPAQIFHVTMTKLMILPSKTCIILGPKAPVNVCQVDVFLYINCHRFVLGMHSRVSQKLIYCENKNIKVYALCIREIQTETLG